MTIGTLVRAVLPLFAVAALLPAVASAQDPGTGGYAASGPTEASATAPPPASTAPAPASATEPAPASSTEPAATEGSNAPAQTVSAPSTTTLPFTGLQIAAMIAAGLGLLGLGIALRRISGPALPGT
jgi:hypothetical protein